MASSPRHHARELVLQALYALESADGSDGLSADTVLREILDNNGDLTDKARAFAELLFQKVIEGTASADEIIARLARNWELGRIAMIDRIVLRMAITEMRTMVDVPVKVVLNEAIELAKTFSTAQSAAFVNGILDSFVKEQPDLSKA
ncbi:transcription antitermination factor NusB [candidate division GN15 bacterium]|nr:transcription antitermination factor NusB [candidate division GN15 bacterium]